MVTKKIGEIAMIEELIDLAALGKKVDLKAKPVRDVIKLEREGETVDSVILSMEYSGTVDGEPFSFKKEYSHAYDERQFQGRRLRDYVYNRSFRQVLDVLKSSKKTNLPCQPLGNCLYRDGVQGLSPASSNGS